jgi:hypothetical protein
MKADHTLKTRRGFLVTGVLQKECEAARIEWGKAQERRR